MNYGKGLAVMQMVIAFAASIGYAVAKDYKRAAYWFFAGCIIWTVTF